MPAAAVASRTPAMAGMAGVVFGARGETAVDMIASCAGSTRASMRRLSVPLGAMDCRVKPGNDDQERNARRLFLRRRRRVERRGIRRGRGLVEALDLGGLAQIVDQFRLSAMRHIVLQLDLDLIEGRRRLGALVLDLDDVPAELGMNGFGNLALVE